MARMSRRRGLFIGLAVVIVYLLFSYSSDYPYRLPDILGSSSFDLRGGGPARDAFRKWRLVKTHFPVKKYIHLPGNYEARIPRIQHDFSKYHESGIHREERQRRREAVKTAFEHSWNGYKKHAWLHDEIKPVSGGSRDPFGAWGATLVDTLDTLWIMGMEKEFEAATGELRKIDFTQCALEEIDVAKTVNRYIGGMLGAYDLSGKKYNVLLHKSIELGEMLYHAFDTPNHMPVTRWNWTVAAVGNDTQEAGTDSLVGELGSMALEFTRLTQITGDKKYFDVVQRVINLLSGEQSKTTLPGLWPTHVDAQNEDLHSSEAFTMGAQAGSVYEYLPKGYLLLSGRDDNYKHMYESALETAKMYLAFEPFIPLQSDESSEPAQPPAPPSSNDRTEDSADLAKHRLARRDYDFSPDYSNPILLGVATSHSQKSSVHLTPLGQHQSCYAGGMVALAARAFAPFYIHTITEENLDLAERLVAGCVWAYKNAPTKIGPELFVAAPCRKGRAAITSGEERDWTGVEPGKCRWDREKYVRAVRTYQSSQREPAQMALDESQDPDFWDNEIGRMGLREGFVDVIDPTYKLKPETIESLFVLWRITGDPKYQDVAWEMWEAIDKVAKTKIAYAGVADVMNTGGLSQRDVETDDDDDELDERDRAAIATSEDDESNSPEDAAQPGQTKPLKEKRRKKKATGPPLLDSMESHWTGGTLKYFYLIFAETNLVSLDEYVYNTAAHPFRWRKGPPKPGENHG